MEKTVGHSFPILADCFMEESKSTRFLSTKTCPFWPISAIGYMAGVDTKRPFGLVYLKLKIVY